MSKSNHIPARIRLSEALEHLSPVMSRSSFYGTSRNPGPRWTHIERLDIREGPPITLDRRAFLAWLDELAGALARGRNPNANRLGDYTRSDASDIDDSLDYVGQLLMLVRALESGRISQEQFDRAVRDLNARGDLR